MEGHVLVSHISIRANIWAGPGSMGGGEGDELWWWHTLVALTNVGDGDGDGDGDGATSGFPMEHKIYLIHVFLFSRG